VKALETHRRCCGSPVGSHSGAAAEVASVRFSDANTSTSTSACWLPLPALDISSWPLRPAVVTSRSEHGCLSTCVWTDRAKSSIRYSLYACTHCSGAIVRLARSALGSCENRQRHDAQVCTDNELEVHVAGGLALDALGRTAWRVRPRASSARGSPAQLKGRPLVSAIASRPIRWVCRVVSCRVSKAACS